MRNYEVGCRKLCISLSVCDVLSLDILIDCSSSWLACKRIVAHQATSIVCTVIILCWVKPELGVHRSDITIGYWPWCWQNSWLTDPRADPVFCVACWKSTSCCLTNFLLVYSQVQLLCFILISCLQDFALDIFFTCLLCLVTVWLLLYVQPIHCFVSAPTFYSF